MDVFKYLKKARQISEEKQPSLAQMQAQKLGLRNIKFGHYIDDRTGERYEVRNGKLEKVLDKEPAADKATEKGPKNFAQMRKDADAAAQQSMDLESELADPQSNRRVPGGPSAQAMDDGDVEQVAIMLSRGRWDVMDPAMKQKKREEARELIARREEEKALAAQMAAQAEEDAAAADEEEAAQPEPEPEEKQENPPITLDQALLDADEDEDTADPELAAKADAIMKALQGGDEVKADKAYASAKKKTIPQQEPTPAPAVSASGEAPTRGAAVVENISRTLSGNLKNTKARELNERLQDPVVRQVASEFIENYINLYSDENMKAFEEGSSFKDLDGARSFLEGQLGMVKNNKGKYSFGESTPAMRIAMGDAPAAGQNFREYRGLTYHEKQALQDPKVREVLDNIIGGTAQPEITYNDRRNFQKGFLKNNISYSDSRELYNQMDGSIQKYLDGLGQPENAMGIYDPKPGTELEYFEDGGKMSGDTNLDMMMNDPDTKEEFLENFSTNKPGKERGVMVLQRLLNTGFKDQATGLPIHGGIRGVTADHIVGRRTVTGDPLDYPLNLALVSRNLNQYKSGNSAQYGDDSFNKVVNSSDNNPFKNSFEGASGEGLENNPEFLAWAANRITDAHFDPKRLKKVMGQGGGDKREFTSNVQEVADMDHGSLEEYMKRGGADKPLGLNLANLTKLVPRPAGKGEQGISKNSWRGTSGVGYAGTEFLNGFRRTMLSNVINNPELNTELETLRKSMAGKGDAQINEAIRKARTSYAEKNLKVPMQGISSIYSLGRIDNKEYVNWFRKKGEENLESLRESNPEMHKKLLQELNSGLDDWEKKLDKIANGPRPYEHKQNDPKVMKAIHDEWGKQIMKSKEARKYLSAEEIEQFYANIKNPDDWREPLGEELTEPQGRARIERLKRSLKDPF